MRYRTSFLIFSFVLFSSMLVLLHPALAKSPLKPDNPGLPGCLAELAELQGQIAVKDAQITELQAEIDELKNQAPVQQTGQTNSVSVYDDGYYQMGVTCPDQGLLLTTTIL